MNDESETPPVGRAGLAVAALILPLLTLLALALAAALLGNAGADIAAALTALGDIAGPSETTAIAMRQAIETGAAAAAAAMLLAWPLGMALEALPWRWGVVGRALLAFPAAILLLTLALAAALSAQTLGPAAALLTAIGSVAAPLDLRLAVAVVALPPMAQAMAARLRLRDRAALRAAASLGLGPAARFRRLVAPELAGVWLNGGAAVFAAGTLLALGRNMAGAPAASPVGIHPLAALAAATAGAILAVAALVRIARRAA